MDWTGKVYPAHRPEIDRKIDRARKINKSRDALGRKSGFASPSGCPLDIELRTVLSALFCALSLKDWGCACEAAALLQDAELRARNALDNGPEGWMKLYSPVNERKIQ